MSSVSWLLLLLLELLLLELLLDPLLAARCLLPTSSWFHSCSYTTAPRLPCRTLTCYIFSLKN